MNKLNQIAESIKAFYWNHPAKSVFILGIIFGFILRSII